MEPFTCHTGRGLPLRRDKVDTDQIIPADYLKRLTRTGFADGLFATWRRDPDFVLNNPRHARASILIAGTDFGIGSSRQHAVWALQNSGFRVIVSPRFGDIFRQNALKDGLLAVQLDTGMVSGIQDDVEADPEQPVTVDLVARRITTARISTVFEIDDHTRWRLIEGYDDIAVTITSSHATIASYEKQRPPWMPDCAAGT